MGKLWAICLFCVSVLGAGEIRWHTNVDEAQKEAKETGKNLFLYFTGSDWCPWCQKMHIEILENKAFQKQAAPFFVFVMVDFPQNKYMARAEKAQNNGLKEKYNIEGFPTVVLVDSNLSFISILGYLPTTGPKYAKHLKKLLAEYKELAAVDIERMSESERVKIYEKARGLDCIGFNEESEKDAFEFSEDPFFHLDEYNLLKCDFTEEVFTSDGANLKEALSNYVNNLKVEESEKALLPLLDYIRTFGARDKAHLWQVEMIIAQFFYRRGNVEKALFHAKACYKAAPLMLRKDLGEVILSIKRRMNNG